MNLPFESLGSIAGDAARKRPEDLSDQEKIALAVMSGCAYRVEPTDVDGCYRVSTVNPVGFQMIDSKLRVVEGPPPREGDAVIKNRVSC